MECCYCPEYVFEDSILSPNSSVSMNAKERNCHNGKVQSLRCYIFFKNHGIFTLQRWLILMIKKFTDHKNICNGSKAI